MARCYFRITALRSLCLACLVFLVAYAGSAYASDATRTADAKSKALRTQFQQKLEEIIKRYDFPGATAAYVLPDGHAEGFAAGLADKEAHRKMTPETRLLSGSIGKTFVAATAVALAQEGRLDLNTKISKWFGNEPWFASLPNAEQITLRMLLNHTSGLPDHVKLPEFAAEAGKDLTKRLSPERLVSFVLNKPALFDAGAGFSYSDTNYILAGMVIEKVSGTTYYDLLKKRFLVPLKLNHTIPSNRRDLPGLATGYFPAKNFLGVPGTQTVRNGLLIYEPANEWTGGGLATTSYDLVRWAKALYEGKAVKESFVDQIVSAGIPQGRDPTGRSYGYGLGARIYESAVGFTYGHAGWIPGYISVMAYAPSLKIAIAFQTNTDAGMGYGGNNAPEIEIRNELLKLVATSLPKH